MTFFLIPLLIALGYLIIIIKALGRRRAKRLQIILDILVTLGLPFLFLGTMTGMVMALMAGLWFSILLYLLPTPMVLRENR